MSKKNVIAQLNLLLIEDNDTTSIDVAYQGKMKDYEFMARRLSETKNGKAVLAIMGAMAEYAKQIA